MGETGQVRGSFGTLCAPTWDPGTSKQEERRGWCYTVTAKLPLRKFGNSIYINPLPKQVTHQNLLLVMDPANRDE